MPITIYEMGREIGCPKCGMRLDAHSGLNSEDMPRAGDYTICGYCFIVMQFDNSMNLHVAINVPRDVRRLRDKFMKFRKAWMN